MLLGGVNSLLGSYVTNPLLRIYVPITSPIHHLQIETNAKNDIDKQTI